MADLPSRFWNSFAKSEGCWVWTGSFRPNGYGSFWLNGKRPGAHRVAYEALVGPIPDALVLDHTCRNRACVNPDHLEPVTSGENVLRGVGPTSQNAKKIKCVHGHALEGENLHVDTHGKRRCKACGAERMRQHRSRKQMLRAA